MISRCLFLIVPAALLAGCEPPPPEPLIEQNVYVQSVPPDPAQAETADEE